MAQGGTREEEEVKLIRFGQDGDCVVFDADDVAWIHAREQQGTVSVMLKCGQQFAVYRESEPELFDEISGWATDQNVVEEYSDLLEIVDEANYVNQLTEVQKAYFAAFVDADGCITIGKRADRMQSKSPRYYLEVKISQCNSPFIKSIEEEIGAGKAYSYQRDTGKNMYRLQIRDAQACEFLRVIYPYLRIKRPQADIAFEFRRTYEIRYGKKGVPKDVSSKRKWCREELQRLKREIGEDSWHV